MSAAKPSIYSWRTAHLTIFELFLLGLPQSLRMPLADISQVPLRNLTRHMEALNLKDNIAFSLSTPASTVQQWQNHLNSMKADGTFETIWNKWFDGVSMP